jgi:hypothetical protein
MISTNKPGVEKACVCRPSYLGGINRRTEVQASQGKNLRLYLKNKAKKDWGMA